MTKTTLEIRVTIEAEGSLYYNIRERRHEIDDVVIRLVGPGGVTLDVPEAMFTPVELSKIVEALVEAREDKS